ncbi:MAG: hypothetical protein E6767_11815 [Dysgonomonas sp.]|nr:hypothetical protein [Dysgonomonas sp.]
MKATAYSLLLLLSIPLCISGQTTGNASDKLASYVNAINNFSLYIPQEKVYLHLDNTSYYNGDNIWFKGYIVTSELHKSSELSKTLYVDLINPGGEIIEKKIIKIENGQCHGDFSFNRPVFYPGFYEIRAYTKYMLNFGDDAIFSRLIPVFSKPKKEGNYQEMTLNEYRKDIINKRPQLKKDKKVNISFYPEGGNLINGLESRVAFYATNEYGEPIEVTGKILNDKKEEVCAFSTTHEGKGIFSFIPDTKKYKVLIQYNNKEHNFDFSTSLLQGFNIKVDNLSYPDKINIQIRKNIETPADTLSLTIICRGKIYNSNIIEIPDTKTVDLDINKNNLPSGISQIVLFNKHGDIICDRLIFINKNDHLTISTNRENQAYKPYEAVNMEFTIHDKNSNPISTPFSLSVKDAANEVEHKHNIMTNLLLTSELKGFINNPSFYFEKEDETRRQALDLLLMVQGWRRYTWKQMAGIEPFNTKYTPEQGIEIEGQIKSFVRGIPKPNVNVSVLLSKENTNSKNTIGKPIMGSCITDSKGKFRITSDFIGNWNMIFSIKEKGKKKDHTILLDRVFYPEPRKYSYPELKLSLTKKKHIHQNTNDIINDENIEALFAPVSEDSITNGIDQKVHHLGDVTVSAKKSQRQKEIEEAQSSSFVYYDVQSKHDEIIDNDKFVDNNLMKFLANSYDEFIYIEGSLQYKDKMPLFVVNYKRTRNDDKPFLNFLKLSNIKSIYISESIASIHRYADKSRPHDIEKMYSCVVFIETYPDEEIRIKDGKGTRKTKLNGYTLHKEFYSPDYSILPPEPDYRRTLYWNPSVMPDENGKVKIQFYNNSTCNQFSISAETVTADGIFGFYKDGEEEEEEK